jgi:hypothetical protein
MADPAAQLPPPPRPEGDSDTSPTPPAVNATGFHGLPAPPAPSEASRIASRNKTRRLLALVAAGVVLLVAVGLATGTLRITFFVQTSSGAAVLPSAVPPLGTAQGGHFTGGGVTFLYPKKWTPVPDPEWTSSANATGLIILGSGPEDEVVVERFRLAEAVTPSNVEQAIEEASDVIPRQAASVGGQVESGPVRTDLGGLPAVQFDESVETGTRLLSIRMVVTFRGLDEYQVSCVRAAELAEKDEVGCARVLSTFRLADG